MEAFRSNSLVALLDLALASLEDQFATTERYYSLFGFLYSFCTLEDSDLKSKCIKLGKALSYTKLNPLNPTSNYEEYNDLNGEELYKNIIKLKGLNPSIEFTPLSVLSYISCDGLGSTFHDLAVALKLFLTIPCTVATSERTFSVLKLVLNYLWTGKAEGRLNDLKILAIETEKGKIIDSNYIFNEFILLKDCRGIL